MKKKFFSKRKDSFVVISPERALTDKIFSSIALIKKTDKEEYQKLKSRIKVIFITNKTGYANEFFMPEKIWFANLSLIRKNDLNWLASLIIHEAYHATQFKNGKYISSFDKLEPLAYKRQKMFLKKLGESGEDVDIAFKQKQWERFNQDKISFSYFRNLLSAFENKDLIIKV